MFDYILFDLDGTLTDPKEGITRSVQYALEYYGISEPNLEKLEPFIGPPLKESFIDYYGFSNEQATEAVEKYRERFSTTGIYENIIYPGTRELLQKLKKSGKHLAVASSKPTVFVTKILAYFQIEEYFDVVMGSELDGTRSKKEDVVKDTLEQLFQGRPVDLKKTVMVGDRKYDIEGAREFGLASIGVSYGYAIGDELQTAGANYIVDTIEELGKLLFNGDEDTESGDTESVDKEYRNSEVQRQPFWKNRQIYDLLQVIYPFLLYYVIYQVVILALTVGIQMIADRMGELAWVKSHSMQLSPIVSAVGMMAGSLFLMGSFLGEMESGYFPLSEKKREAFIRFIRIERAAARKIGISYLPLILFSISATYFLNILFELTGFFTISDKFSDVAARQMSIPLWLALILYGVISPFAEELVFRGLIYNRLKKVFPLLPAAIVGALVFGLYHENLVQGVYGFIAGLLIIYAYETYENFLAPLFFHSVANIAVLLASYLAFNTKVFHSVAGLIGFGLITLLSLGYLWRIKSKTIYKR